MKRVTAALDRKLSASEARYKARVTPELVSIIRSTFETVTGNPAAVANTVMLDSMREMAEVAFLAAADMFREFTVENGVSVQKELVAVASNLGVTVDDLFADWEPFGWENGAISQWADILNNSVVKAGGEIVKQAGFSRLYDDIPAEGFLARLFSEREVRRMGRSGRGLFWSLASVMLSGAADPAFKMVNAQRVDLFRLVVERANA